jgi:adenine-specific DNA-methyltransferase
MTKSKYDNYTHAQLVEELKKLSKRKKYGLVWEEERIKEKFEAEAEGKLPVLFEDKKLEIKNKDSEKPIHIIIEGDNYHSLSVLNYTHSKSIDVIYIDPPYNTGAKDWKYNNHYVDLNDTFRHSKWISLMEKRLKLAKNLLKHNGVLIVTIDDNELCTLGLLLDELFPNKERTTVVIKYNPAGTARSGFSRCHEYALFLLNSAQSIEKKDAPLDERSRNLRRNGNNSNRSDSPTMFYPIYIEKKTLKVTGAGDVPKTDFHPMSQTIEHQDYYEIWPLDEQNKEKNWYYSRKRVLDNGKDELVCRWIKNRLHVYFSTSNNSEQKYQTVWVGSEYDAGAYGSSLVKSILDKEFPFPKSLYAVKDCLKAIIKKNKKAIVLDFFAGSGTTGHAVLDLNRDDGGQRQFILCTNNENDICREITYPRIKNIIQGYKNVKGDNIEGYGGGLKLYGQHFIGSEPTHRNKKLLTLKSAEMLCIKENTFEEVFRNKYMSIFKNQIKFTAILLDDIKMIEFKKEISKIKLPISVYVFSLEGDDYSEDFDDLKNHVTLCSIPEAILKVYRRIYETANPKNRK